MAIIPKTRENTRMNVSAPVPIGSGDFARARGEAMEKLGGQMVNFGENLYKAEAATKATQAGVELDNFYKKARLDAVQTATADGSDVEQKFKEIVDNGVGAIREKYSGNVLANAKINAFNDAAYKESETAMYAQKINMATEYHTNAVKEFQLGQQNIIYNSSSAEKPAYLRAALVQNNNLLDTHVKNGIISPANAAKLRDDFQARLGDALVDGYVQNKDNGKALALIGAMQDDTQLFNEYPPEQAKNLGFVTDEEAAQLSAKGENYKVPVMTAKDKMKSKLTPEEALVMSHLPEAKREQLKAKLEAKMQADAYMRMSDISAKMAFYSEAALQGRATKEDRDRILQNINSQPNLTKDARARLSARVVLDHSISEQAKQMIMTPVGQHGKILDQMDKISQREISDLIKANPALKGMENDLSITGVQMEARGKLETALKTMTTKAKADPPLFHVSVDPTAAQLFKGAADAGHTPEGTQALKDYNDYIISRSKYMGLPEKILTQDQVQQFQAGIKQQTTSGGLNTFILEEKKKYGPHFPKALSELVASDEEFKPYAALAYIDPHNTKPVLDAIKNKSAINAEFGDGGKYGGMAPLLKRRISNANTPLRNMFVTGADDLTNLNNMQGLESAITLVAQQDVMINNTPLEVAADNAYKRVVNDNYHIVNASKSSVLVPRQGVNDPVNIKKFLQSSLDPENINALGIGANVERAAQTAKWVTNPDQTGVVLVAPSVKTGNLIPVTDKNKKPIQRSYEELKMWKGK